MKASTDWMAKNYQLFNEKLFNGRLGQCNFEIFTSGRGSEGHTLGRFKLNRSGLYVERYNRAMYVRTFNGKEYVNYKNFYDLCNPCIMLNGHYSGTESALQGTLVHEMVHYYDYMYGRCPRQAHGPSFREMAAIVSSRSNGMFTIKRLADAEEMKNYELDDDMKEKAARRVANKKSRAVAIFVFKKDGHVELTITSNTNTSIQREIYNYYTSGKGKGEAKEIIVSSDPSLIELLYNDGRRKLMRTWRYWNVENTKWIKDIRKYNYECLFNINNVSESMNVDNIKKIVESAVNEFVDNIEGDDIMIGGMDLELKSPLE